MKQNKGISLVVLLMLFVWNASGQVTKFRVSEVMVINTDNYIDSYGERSGWIELYNTYSSTIDLRGCYLSNDPSNLKKYPIPTGDFATQVGPRQSVVFFADNKATRGTFHVNFELKKGEVNIIIFSDNSGNEVDRIVIPASLGENEAYGRVKDQDAILAVLVKPTPNALNFIKPANEASNRIKTQDPTGLGMTITAMSVVFSALLLLYLVFKYAGRFHSNRSVTQKENAISANESAAPAVVVGSYEISGEVIVAIGLALHQMQNSDHDNEETILTFEKLTKRYSPWSSKIHSLRQVPEVKPQIRTKR